MKLSKKFSLTRTTHPLYPNLHQIKALRSFGTVSKGDLGGYIEKEANLSHEGTCWVYGSAGVYGNARVYDNAWVSGNARVSGDARVSGNARVGGDAAVSGNAVVYGDARVYGNATVSGDAGVSGPVEFSNPLVAALVNLGACTEALQFIGKRSLVEAWGACDREDWKNWLRARGLNPS